MVSHTFNIARVTGLPPVKRLAAALDAFGLPDDGLFGVLEATASKEAVLGTVVFRCSQTVRSVDPTTRAVVLSEIDKVIVYPFTAYPAKGIIEVRAGSTNGLSRLQDFLAKCLSTTVEVEPIDLEISMAVRKLNSQTKRFLVRSVRIEHYAAKSYMSGTYSPRFADSDHAMDFIEANPGLTAASVRFAAPSGIVSLQLNSRSCFRYTCDEDENSSVQAILRKLV
jgi:hypothetical protein